MAISREQMLKELLPGLNDLSAPQPSLARVQPLALDVPSDPEFALVLRWSGRYQIMTRHQATLMTVTPKFPLD